MIVLDRDSKSYRKGLRKDKTEEGSGKDWNKVTAKNNPKKTINNLLRIHICLSRFCHKIIKKAAKIQAV